MASKFKKGDKVVVLAGRDRGKRGEITQMFPREDRATVSGVNVVRRHTRSSQFSQGGIIEKEAKIHLSNLALEDPKDGAPTRVGFMFVGEGEERRKVRVAKKSGEIIDG